ncbi:MAG: hypothetical protein Kow0040_14800 [Thermogutta sp.]
MTREEMARIQVPLDSFVREIAKDAAREAAREYFASCPIKDIERRVTALEKQIAFAAGAIVGSGILGGTIGAMITQMIH